MTRKPKDDSKDHTNDELDAIDDSEDFEEQEFEEDDYEDDEEEGEEEEEEEEAETDDEEENIEEEEQEIHEPDNGFEEPAPRTRSSRDNRVERSGERRRSFAPSERPRNGVALDQRIVVLVDVQNMYFGAKNIYGGRVAYERLFEHCVKNRRLVHALAYIVSRPGTGQEAFFEMLKNVGFELCIKEAPDPSESARRVNWDVGLALDALMLSERVDVIHLVSGDGDFVDLLEVLRARGVRVEVSSFPENTSDHLIRAATQYYALTREVVFGEGAFGNDGPEHDDPQRRQRRPRRGQRNYRGGGGGRRPRSDSRDDAPRRDPPPPRAYDPSLPAPHEYTSSGRVIPERGRGAGLQPSRGRGGRGGRGSNPYDQFDDNRGNRR